MTGDQPNLMRACGWPWDRLSEAAFACHDASRRAEDVLDKPDAGANERFRAEFELQEALAAVRLCRENLADIFLLMLRCALDVGNAPALAQLLERLVGTPTMALLKMRTEWAEETAATTERKIQALTSAVERLRRENWELARAVAELQHEEPARV